MTGLALTWAIGFLVWVGAMVATNIRSPDPDEHWPPGAVVLAVLWPLLLILFSVGIIVEFIFGDLTEP